ncbi:TonB-linked outer membrane protein, SusC/RagA family [Mariniphaga anaerophila]|uniref:TonB-linked outer membrane protein, SusC/RagA family n=1 Tax=Mariniphaga anaerophila TaxID=1484053 RepID=A0A1M5E717_9BACT|nr:TonB-dependent receptor [Mariniphaga anaerophila]SHF74955.1 TonB-linked outer membrane protein, SusC/RagA family [Mariniphaga anaerophila]
MKKKLLGKYPDTTKQLLRKMKITALLLFFCVSALFANEVKSQNAKVNIALRNVTVAQVIFSIEDQTDYLFVYDKNEIDLLRRVDVNVEEKPVEFVLHNLFEGTNVSFGMVGNNIILMTKVAIFQQKSVSGKVTDSSGSPLPGVTVVVKGAIQGTVTNAEGIYSLTNIPEKAILVFSFVGMKTQEVSVLGKALIDIVMEVDAIGLDEIVAIGYGTQRKGNLTGSVASVKADKLTVAPTTSVTNTLGGQLAGLKTKQISGIPGSDGAKLSIRGFNSPLVIVDGVETSFNNIDASQIESISILKDGAASIYGARAGNGVVLVTLKRGRESEISVFANGSVTFQNSTNLIKSGSSGQRAEWEREAHINANLPSSQIPWTLTEIQKFFDGGDPEYLNTDWFSSVVRPWAPQQNHNLSVSGGNEKVRFLSYLGYNNQQTISRHDGGGYNRINFQGNVDADIIEGLSLSSSVNYIKELRDFTAMNLFHSNYYYALYDSDPRYHLHLPDETKLSYAGSSYGNALFVSRRNLAGYSRSNNQSIRINGSVMYNFQSIKGLKLKAFVHYNSYFGLSKMFKKQPDFYSYNAGTDEYSFERKAQDATILSQGSSYSDDLTQQYSVSYRNTFNDDHNLSVLALHERISYKNEGFDTQRGNFKTSVIDQMFAGDPTTASNNATASEMGRSSFVSRVNYGYKNKYLVETIFRADASAKFPKDGRWGFFPSVSVGWMASEERFLEDVTALDNLKVRGSFGQSGDDGIGNYQYYAGYSYDMAYILGNEISQGLYSTGLANSILSWERISIYNMGVDFSFLDRNVYGTVEGFYRSRDGIPGYRTESLPSTFGAALPLENLNSIDTRGFEVEIGTSGKLAEFSYSVSGNISWARSKWVKYDEPEYEDPDQKRIYGVTGKWTDERFGYISDGVFTSMEEISALDYIYKDIGGNESIKPGDVKYIDVNGDKVLDWKDQVKIGKGTMPNWMYGVNLGILYRNLDLNMLFQGAFGYTSYIDLETAPTVLKFENRWTETENNKNSLVPRPGSKNPANWWYSDYRNHNASYVRLKNMSVGYTLNSNLLDRLKMSNLRVYVAGTNLFAISSLSKYGVDPEAPEGTPAYYYPQQRTISLGLSVSY